MPGQTVGTLCSEMKLDTKDAIEEMQASIKFPLILCLTLRSYDVKNTY